MWNLRDGLETFVATVLYSARPTVSLPRARCFTKVLRWPPAGRLDRSPGFPLVRIARVAVAKVGDRHRQRPVLELPHVAELVRDQVAVRVVERAAEQAQPPRGIAVEAPEPREPEQPRDDDDAYPV